MSLEYLISLSKVRQLSEESLLLLEIARAKHKLLDECLEKQVENKTPSEEILNKRVGN